MRSVEHMNSERRGYNPVFSRSHRKPSSTNAAKSELVAQKEARSQQRTIKDQTLEYGIGPDQSCPSLALLVRKSDGFSGS